MWSVVQLVCGGLGSHAGTRYARMGEFQVSSNNDTILTAGWHPAAFRTTCLGHGHPVYGPARVSACLCKLMLVTSGCLGML